MFPPCFPQPKNSPGDLGEALWRTGKAHVQPGAHAHRWWSRCGSWCPAAPGGMVDMVDMAYSNVDQRLLIHVEFSIYIYIFMIHIYLYIYITYLVFFSPKFVLKDPATGKHCPNCDVPTHVAIQRGIPGMSPIKNRPSLAAIWVTFSCKVLTVHPHLWNNSSNLLFRKTHRSS